MYAKVTVSSQYAFAAASAFLSMDLVRNFGQQYKTHLCCCGSA